MLHAHSALSSRGKCMQSKQEHAIHCERHHHWFPPVGLRPAPFKSQLYRRRLQLTLYDGTGLDQKLHSIPVAANCTVVRSLVSSCLVKCNGSVPKFCSCVSTVKAYCTHFLLSPAYYIGLSGVNHTGLAEVPLVCQHTPMSLVPPSSSRPSCHLPRG